MIKDQTLDQAIIEALRFVKAAKALRAARSSEWQCEQKSHAAAGRASMDLTRVLAGLRQGR